MPKKPNNFFAGIFFPKRNKKNSLEIQIYFSKTFFPKEIQVFFRTKKIFPKLPHKNFPKFGNKLVTKRVAKDIDPTRVKRIELTNKDKIRNRLETQAHFPQESPSFFQVLRKTILDYFLPFPPPPPLEDPRNMFPENKNGSQR